MNQALPYKQFWLACIVTVVASLILFFLSFYIGKNNFFLLLNNNYGSFADYFFQYYTYLGDGVIWAILLLTFLKYNKQNIPLLIAAFVICTLLVQVCKYIIVPNELRPIAAIQPNTLVHIPIGTEPHETASFPSGHTSAAFCFFLLATLFIKRSWIIVVGFLYALTVGYSRVYLAQHFPFDVAAGMLVAVITLVASLYFQQFWERKKSNTTRN